MIAIFSPWVWATQGSQSDIASLWFVFQEAHKVGYMIAALLFIMGTLFAFFTPVGGFLQLPGCIVFVVAFYDSLRTADPDIDYGLGMGLYVGFIASAITIASFARPVGPGFRPASTKRWLVAFYKK